MPRDSVDRIIEAWSERDPTVDASPLEVVGRLLLCAGYLERAIVDALQPFGLSFGDFDVLNTLRRVGSQQGTNPSDLAKASLVTTGAMTSRLDRLERVRLITRMSSAEDRRAILVRLTRRGESIAEKALHAVIAADEAFLEPLSRPQRDAVAALLKRLLLASEAAHTPRAPSRGGSQTGRSAAAHRRRAPRR